MIDYQKIACAINAEYKKLDLEVFRTMCGLNDEKAKKTENCRGCIYHGEHRDMGATIEVCNREDDLGKAVATCENSANCGNKLTLADVEKLKAERDAAAAEIERLKMIVNNYRISTETFAEENHSLHEELEKLQSERDAFFEDFLRGYKEQIETKHGVYRCDMCKHAEGHDLLLAMNEKDPCPEDCDGYKHWEWRGARHD